MPHSPRLDLSGVEQRVCDIAAALLGVPRTEVQPSSRLIEDLHCDSLDLIELLLKLEDEFLVTIPNRPTHAVGKAIFTRHPFRLRDLAEFVFLQQGSGRPARPRDRRSRVPTAAADTIPFSQLGGRWRSDPATPATALTDALWEPLGVDHGVRQFRRRTDGMRCLLLPAAEFPMGCDHAAAAPDEQPVHTVRLDSFLIDAEPVSTTAYCRFVNSVEATAVQWRDWFQLEPHDDRLAQLPLVWSDAGWQPVVGTETLPMVLVSWFGANAYSLWANGGNWRLYQSHDGFLPSEAQWEYAAQGAYRDPSEEEAGDARFVFGQHERGVTYQAETLPLAPVHVPLGRSTFGLHHMAGNVWQWCRDWFAEDFYDRPEAREANPVNTLATGIRSERGGSWVGPRALCRTTYRRGRAPTARGRCLGFRCMSDLGVAVRGGNLRVS
jgi:sulfatase modifying factor 1